LQPILERDMKTKLGKLLGQLVRISALLSMLILVPIGGCMDREMTNPNDEFGSNRTLAKPYFLSNYYEPGSPFTPWWQVYVGCSSACEKEIRYTTDNTDPTDTSQLYDGPLAFHESTILKVRAFADGWQPSPVAKRTFNINKTQ